MVALKRGAGTLWRPVPTIFAADDEAMRRLTEQRQWRTMEYVEPLAFCQTGYMSTQTQYPHLTIDDQGVARIGKTRLKVIHLAAEHYQHGWSGEDLLRHHPELRPEQVYASLTYFYDHRDAMIAELTASLDATEQQRLAQRPMREELLRRKAQREK